MCGELDSRLAGKGDSIDSNVTILPYVYVYVCMCMCGGGLG